MHDNKNIWQSQPWVFPVQYRVYDDKLPCMIYTTNKYIVAVAFLEYKLYKCLCISTDTLVSMYTSCLIKLYFFKINYQCCKLIILILLTFMYNCSSKLINVGGWVVKIHLRYYMGNKCIEYDIEDIIIFYDQSCRSHFRL